MLGEKWCRFLNRLFKSADTTYNLVQNCWDIFLIKLLSPLPKINVIKDSAPRMSKGHVYTNIAWWGREGEDV